MLTQTRLKELLSYCKETGQFTWKVYRCWKTGAGDIAGTLNKTSGYRYICIEGKLHREHRLAWLYVYGYFPKEDIDHINKVRNDNRIENLRECDRSFNLLDASGKKNNSTGHKGVHLQPNGRYHAYVGGASNRTNIGYYATLEEALAARKAAIAALNK